MSQRSLTPLLAAGIGLLSILALLLMVRSLSEPPSRPLREAPFPQPQDDADPATVPPDYLSSLEFTSKVRQPFAELPEPEAPPAERPLPDSLPPPPGPPASRPAQRPKPRLTPVKSITAEPPKATSSAFLPVAPPPEKDEAPAAPSAPPPAKPAPPVPEPPPQRSWRSVEGY